MKIKLCHAAQRWILNSKEKPVEFSESSSFTWWPEEKLTPEQEKEILSKIATDDRYRQDYNNHILAKYFINNLKVHAYIHSETELPDTDCGAALDKNDLIRLSNYQNARTLLVKTGKWDNLQEGYRTFVADFDHVYRSSADFMFHGYMNAAEDDFVTMMCVRWKNGLQNVMKEFTEHNKSITWRFDDFFVCINYDDLVRQYGQYVVCYDATYWINKGVVMNFGERIGV